jgi:hypothetical protein
MDGYYRSQISTMDKNKSYILNVRYILFAVYNDHSIQNDFTQFVIHFK